jgi:CSLREA domain-containing protein
MQNNQSTTQPSLLLVRLGLVLALLAAALGTQPVPVIQAAAIIVTTVDDEDNTNPAECSLREAITAANIDAPYGGCEAGYQADMITLPPVTTP